MLLWHRTISLRKTFKKNALLIYVWDPISNLSLTCGSFYISSLSLSNVCSTSQPTQGPGLIDTFVCNCTDCRKITASMFASNFIVADTHLKHLRGQENLKTFSQSHTIASGNNMTNFFCSTCGTLMYRVGSAWPGHSILRIGTVDDFNLQETKLRPRVEQFTKDRVSWFSGVEGAKQTEASAYSKAK